MDSCCSVQKVSNLPDVIQKWCTWCFSQIFNSFVAALLWLFLTPDLVKRKEKWTEKPSSIPLASVYCLVDPEDAPPIPCSAVNELSSPSGPQLWVYILVAGEQLEVLRLVLDPHSIVRRLIELSCWCCCSYPFCFYLLFRTSIILSFCLSHPSAATKLCWLHHFTSASCFKKHIKLADLAANFSC